MLKPPVRYGPHGQYVEVFGVPSESNPALTYTVARTAENKWSCSCPRWTRNASRPICKHILHVQAFTARQSASAPVVAMPESVKKAITKFSLLEV